MVVFYGGLSSSEADAVGVDGGQRVGVVGGGPVLAGEVPEEAVGAGLGGTHEVGVAFELVLDAEDGFHLLTEVGEAVLEEVELALLKIRGLRWWRGDGVHGGGGEAGQGGGRETPAGMAGAEGIERELDLFLGGLFVEREAFQGRHVFVGRGLFQPGGGVLEPRSEGVCDQTLTA